MHVDSDDWVEMNLVELLVRRKQGIDADIVTGEAVFEGLHSIEKFPTLD